MNPFDAFVIPRYLFTLNQPLHPVLRIDDFSFAEYRQTASQYKSQVIVTASLFVVVLSGKKIIHTPDGDLMIHPGQAFFARKGTYLFSEVITSRDDYRALIFFIDDCFLEQFLARYTISFDNRPASEEKGLFEVPVSGLLETGIRSILPYFQHRTGSNPQLLRLKLEELLLHILDNDSEGNFANFLHMLYSTRKRELKSLMEKYFTRPVTIEELAKLSGRSLSAFKREFKEVFQDTPRHWITNRRLEYARVLLRDLDKNVSEVCMLSGFENFSHFSQIFKKKFGISPSMAQKN